MWITAEAAKCTVFSALFRIEWDLREMASPTGPQVMWIEKVSSVAVAPQRELMLDREAKPMG